MKEEILNINISVVASGVPDIDFSQTQPENLENFIKANKITEMEYDSDTRIGSRDDLRNH